MILQTFEAIDEARDLSAQRMLALKRMLIEFADQRAGRQSLDPLLRETDALSAAGQISLSFSLRRIALAKLNLFAFSEMVVLWMLGGFAIATAVVFRTNALIGDLTAVVLTCAVVFLSSSVADQANYISTRALRDLGAADGAGAAREGAAASLESQARPLVSVFLLAAIFFGYVLAAAEKHGAAPLSP